MGSFPSKMEFFLFPFLFLAVAGSWHDQQKECTRYRIWAKAAFEGGFPAKVVLGIPADMEMSDKVAKMNIRKGCREMCGGTCQYRGEDLFDPELCEEFDGGNVAPPSKIPKPKPKPKPQTVDQGPNGPAPIEPADAPSEWSQWSDETSSESSSIYWNPFWWMEEEKKRIEKEKTRLQEKGELTEDKYKDFMANIFWSEGSSYKSSGSYESDGSYVSEGSSFSWGSYDNSWEYYGYDHSWDYYQSSDELSSFFDMDKMDLMVNEFENTWTDYKWDEFWLEPTFVEIDYEMIKAPERWDDHWFEKPDQKPMIKPGMEKPGMMYHHMATQPSMMSKPHMTTDMMNPQKARQIAMGRSLPPALQHYMSDYACGMGLDEDDSPECIEAKEAFSNAANMFEEMAAQPDCIEHCGQTCGFLVNSVSFLLLSLCYLLFNESH